MVSSLMSNMFDVIVIGSGPGGQTASIRTAQLGGKVAVIERSFLGGVCTNWGCIPTKALLRSVECLEEIKRSQEFGIKVGEISFDLESIVKRKDTIISKLRDGIKYLFESNNIVIFKGKGILSGPNSVTVKKDDGTSEEIKAKSIILATGSKNKTPPMSGIESIVDNANRNDILSPKKIPNSLLIIGGGPEGAEFACIYAALGSKVTIVEMMSTLIPTEEKELGIRLARALNKKGIRIMLGATVKNFNKDENQVNATIKSKVGEESLAIDKVLIAAGRAPNIDELGLESVGISYNSRGIFVDERMETNIRDIYAVGDLVTVSLAHVASEQGVVAAENSMGLKSTYDPRAIPRCVYTIPEVAAVGLTLKDAKDQGYDVINGRFPFSANGRALTLGDVEGTVKIIAEKTSKEILGIHIIGPRASDLIPEATLAIKLKLKLTDLSTVIHPHPTLSEVIKEAALDAEGFALNLAAKGKDTNN